MALKHSKISVANMTAGPNLRISSGRCTSTCSFALVKMRLGSTAAQASSTLSMRTVRSDCQRSDLSRGPEQDTHEIQFHVTNFWHPEQCTEFARTLPETKDVWWTHVMKMEDTKLLQNLEMLSDQRVLVLDQICRAKRRESKPRKRRGLQAHCKGFILKFVPGLVCRVPDVLVVPEKVCV